MAKPGQEKKERTEEFLLPDNEYTWLRYNHGNKLKLFRNHLHLKQVSKARKMKNDLIQDFKKENPTKDVGKLLVIKMYSRYQQIGYYDSEDNTDG